MNIYAISYNSNPNFGITRKVRIPMKDGTTTLLSVTGETKRQGNLKITKIIGEIMSKGKSVGKVQTYEDAQGLDVQILAEAADEIGANAKNPESVIGKIFDAIIKPCADHNA